MSQQVEDIKSVVFDPMGAKVYRRAEFKGDRRCIKKLVVGDVVRENKLTGEYLIILHEKVEDNHGNFPENWTEVQRWLKDDKAKVLDLLEWGNWV